MINDDNDNEKYYYSEVNSKLELCLSEWSRSKKQSISNEDSYFQNVWNDSLDYQSIKKNREKNREYQNLSHILVSITGKT